MKLTDLPQPSVAGVVREKTVVGAIAEINNCLYGGADMIDLHMSCLDDPGEENLQKNNILDIPSCSCSKL